MREGNVSEGNDWRLSGRAYAPTIKVKTQRETSVENRRGVPVLQARAGGLAERVAVWLGGLHPVFVFVVVMLVGLAALAALSIGLGFLVTRVLEQVGGIGAADERVNVWLAAHRTSSRTDASLVGSIVAGGVALPIVVGSIALVSAALRKWRIAAFAVFALAVGLERLPVDTSYPSGHTAASIAVYGGLVLLLTSTFKSGVFRAFAWTFALAMVTFVATARMYRGMHHPLDVAGGLVVGIAAVIVLVFTSRAAGAAAEARSARGGE